MWDLMLDLFWLMIVCELLAALAWLACEVLKKEPSHE
jgi:hypothetical protein